MSSPFSAVGRFAGRSADYVRYRPGYPPALIECLIAETGLSPTSVVADVGAGTGLSAEPFLLNGNFVYGVEPDSDMRAAGEDRLSGHLNYLSVDGTAEATGLSDVSVDYVAAGQAFHWFDRPAAAREFRRVLRPGGWLVLFWNTARTDGTPFLRGYERLLREHGTDYLKVVHRNLGADVFGDFFGPAGYARRSLPNAQRLDRDGLLGRVFSCSYMPAAGHPGHAAVRLAAERLFDDCQSQGEVELEYDTELYFGRLG